MTFSVSFIWPALGPVIWRRNLRPQRFRRAPAWTVLPMLYCPPNTQSRCSGDPSQKAFRDAALIGSPTD